MIAADAGETQLVGEPDGAAGAEGSKLRLPGRLGMPRVHTVTRNRSLICPVPPHRRRARFAHQLPSR